ncbi:MAG: hypothetical protein ACPF9D_06470 [Owenweeksia sp.]
MPLKQVYFLLPLLFMALVNQTYAQELKKEGKLNPQYYHGAQEISYNEVIAFLQTKPVTKPYLERIHKYDVRKDIALGTCITTGLLATVIPAKREFDPALLFGGMALASFTAYVIYTIRWQRELGNAISVYNNVSVESRLIFNSGGIGVQMTF